MAVRSKWQSLPTEAINPATLGIDKLSPADIVELMLSEDRKMLAAVQREHERIAVGIEMIAAALRKEGRVIFVGAGTSGRHTRPVRYSNHVFRFGAGEPAARHRPRLLHRGPRRVRWRGAPPRAPGHRWHRS